MNRVNFLTIFRALIVENSYSFATISMNQIFSIKLGNPDQ